MISPAYPVRKHRYVILQVSFCTVIIPDQGSGSRWCIYKGHGIKGMLIYQLPDHRFFWWCFFVCCTGNSARFRPNGERSEFSPWGEYPERGREVAKAEGSGIWGQPSPTPSVPPPPKGEYTQCRAN